MRQWEHVGQKQSSWNYSIKILLLTAFNSTLCACESSSSSEVDSLSRSTMEVSKTVAGEQASGQTPSVEQDPDESTAGEMTIGGSAGTQLSPLPPESPSIQRLSAYINRDDRSLGIRIEGRDELNKVFGFTLQYYFENGAPLYVGQDGPEPNYLRFSKLTKNNGKFIGEWSHSLLNDQSFDLQRLSEAQVTVHNGQNPMHESRPTIKALMDTPIVSDLAPCDPYRGLSRCEDKSLCGEDIYGNILCQPSVLECPDDFEAIDLNMAGGLYEGDTTGRPSYGAGTCGGGTSAQVFRYTAMSEGNYTFRVQPLGSSTTMIELDSLIWIRSHCAFVDVTVELACNDDADPSMGDFGSRLTLDLDEEQVIFIFVDGFTFKRNEQSSFGWSGPFVIEVSEP